MHPFFLRRAPGGIEKVKRDLKIYVRGWYNYFAEGIPTNWKETANRLIRRRVRQLLWKQWKKPENRHKQLMRIGSNIPPLGEFAYSSNRYWRISKTYLLYRVLCKNVLAKTGWFYLESVEIYS